MNILKCAGFKCLDGVSAHRIKTMSYYLGGDEKLQGKVVFHHAATS